MAVCNYSLAPAATRICTISAVPRRRAADRSDSPLALLAFTSAPAATRIFSASALFRQIAVYSSDSPLARLAFTSAPAAIRIRTASGLSRHIAVYSSGSLSWSRAFTSAPAVDENPQRLCFVPPNCGVEERVVIGYRARSRLHQRATRIRTFSGAARQIAVYRNGSPWSLLALTSLPAVDESLQPRTLPVVLRQIAP